MAKTKACRHTNALNERKIESSQINIKIAPSDGDERDVFLCLSCFRPFEGKNTFSQHGRHQNHFWAWIVKAESFFCIPCSSTVDLELLNAKQRENVELCSQVLKKRLISSSFSTIVVPVHPSADDSTPVKGKGKGKGEKKGCINGVSPSPLPARTLEPPTKIIGMRPVGLYNLGNTCFMNAALQSLASIDLAISDDASFNENDAPLTRALFNLLTTMKGAQSTPITKLTVQRKRKNSDYPPNSIDPSHFFEELSQKYDFFERNEQQDSHDFLRLLFNALDDECPKEIKGRAWHQQVFGGVTCLRVRCDRCKNITFTKEDSLDLSLSINTQKNARVKGAEDISNSFESLSLEDENDDFGKVTIAELIKEWNRPQSLSGEDAFACENCYKLYSTSALTEEIDHARRVVYTTALCQYFVKRPPRVLLIHLQRFSITARRRGRFGYGKDHKPVYASPIFNLAPVTHFDHLENEHGHGEYSNHNAIDNEKEIKYKLRAMVIHEGSSAQSGHYIAQARWQESSTHNLADKDQPHESKDNEDPNEVTDERDSSWFRISDSSVFPISESTALVHPGPYILFYERL